MIGVAMYELVGSQVLAGVANLTHIKVHVGHDNLVGEVIRIDADRATIQVYEETGTLVWALPKPREGMLMRFSWCHCWRPRPPNRKAFVCRIGSWLDGNDLRWYSTTS